MNWQILLLLAAGLASCTHFRQPEQWSNSNTGKVTCLRYEQEACGLHLEGCGPDHSGEFSCLQDAVYSGPVIDLTEEEATK